MNSPKYLLAATVLALAASAHADPLIDEGFDNITTLAADGWVLTNESLPIGTTNWFQGDASIFAAQAGSSESYIAANYNNGVDGGWINNWLITPTFSTESAGNVTFWAKADIFDSFVDKLRIGLSTGSTDPFDFTLSPAITVTGEWVQYSLAYAAGGAGSVARFAIDYTGFGSKANYVGIDTLAVTPVPEPSTWAMFGIGLIGMAAYSRRRVAQAQA